MCEKTTESEEFPFCIKKSTEFFFSYVRKPTEHRQLVTMPMILSDQVPGVSTDEDWYWE